MLNRLNAVNSMLYPATQSRVSALTSVGSFGSRAYTSTDPDVEAQEVLDMETEFFLSEGRYLGKVKRNVEYTVSGGAVNLGSNVVKVVGSGYSEGLELDVQKSGVGFVDRLLTHNGASASLTGSPGFANKYLVHVFYEVDFDELSPPAQRVVVARSALRFVGMKGGDPNKMQFLAQQVAIAEALLGLTPPPVNITRDERLGMLGAGRAA